jgi:hypothetical protein
MARIVTAAKMGSLCSSDEGDKKCMQHFYGEAFTKSDTWTIEKEIGKQHKIEFKWGLMNVGLGN